MSASRLPFTAAKFKYQMEKWVVTLYEKCLLDGIHAPSVSVSLTGMTIPDEDTEAGQTGKYCLVAIGRLQVCDGCNKSSSLFVHTEPSNGILCAVCHFNNSMSHYGTEEEATHPHVDIHVVIFLRVSHGVHLFIWTWIGRLFPIIWMLS